MLAIVIFSALAIGDVFVNERNSQSIEDTTPKPSFDTDKYVQHEAIEIRNDEELAEVALEGTGTSEEPYLIAGYYIPERDQSELFHIYVASTTKYFIIEDCYFFSDDRWDNFLYLSNIKNNTLTIRNNTFEGYGEDIRLDSCDAVTITNNSFIDFYLAIYTLYSDDLIITDNYFSYKTNSVFNYVSENVTIESNYYVKENNFQTSSDTSNEDIIFQNKRKLTEIMTLFFISIILSLVIIQFL